MNHTTDRRIPKRLKIEPLLEAVWELRFAGDSSTAIALPGALLERLRAAGRQAKPEYMPLASVPAEFRKANEQMQYSPTAALRGDGWTVLTGDNVIALNVQRPYPGWARFRAQILELANCVKETALIREPVGIAVRYVDYFPGTPQETLKLLAANIQVGGLTPESGSIRLQMPVSVDGMNALIQIFNPVRLKGDPATEATGLVTDVLVADNLAKLAGPWDGLADRLDKAKAACHRLFFSLLTMDTINALEPVYED